MKIKTISDEEIEKKRQERDKETYFVKTRVLPHNIDLEQNILGAIFYSNSRFEEISKVLKPEHFYYPTHQKIYEIIEKFIIEGKEANPYTLKEYFINSQELEKVGGWKYLIDLFTNALFIDERNCYAEEIYKLYVRREAIKAAEDLIFKTLGDVETETDKIIESLELRLNDLANSGARKGGFVSFSENLSKTISALEKKYKENKTLTGITSGLRDMDKAFGGLNGSDLIILAGRPSMGKTALATDIAVNAATAFLDKKDGGGKVAFFSLEMSAEQLISRILSEKFGKGLSQLDKIFEEQKKLSRLPLFIDDASGLTVADIITRARRLKQKEGIDLIVIDYLQKINTPERKYNDTKTQQISEITNALKNLAKELDIPVLVLSQLSRAVESRDNKKPNLSDLRESGAIEQDADIVMFVYREEYYLKNSEPSREEEKKHEEWERKMRASLGKAEIIVGKNRNGETKNFELFFDSRYTHFTDKVA